MKKSRPRPQRQSSTLREDVELFAAEQEAQRVARVFLAQMETLKRYRSGGEQKVTIRHELVSEEGQAIVRTFMHTKSHRPSLKNPLDETPALSDSRQAAMPMPGDLAYERLAWLEYEARKNSSS